MFLRVWNLAPHKAGRDDRDSGVRIPASVDAADHCRAVGKKRDMSGAVSGDAVSGGAVSGGAGRGRQLGEQVGIEDGHRRDHRVLGTLESKTEHLADRLAPQGDDAEVPPKNSQVQPDQHRPAPTHHDRGPRLTNGPRGPTSLCGPHAVAVSTHRRTNRPPFPKAADPQDVVEQSPHTLGLSSAVQPRMSADVIRSRRCPVPRRTVSGQGV